MFQVVVTQNMKVTKTKKTSLARKELKPSFNQSFDIQLDRSLISNTFLTLQLKQARVFAVKDLTLGSTILGNTMFARGTGARQWDKAVKTSNKEIIEEVHTLNTAGAQINSIM